MRQRLIIERLNRNQLIALVIALTLIFALFCQHTQTRWTDAYRSMLIGEAPIKSITFDGQQRHIFVDDPQIMADLENDFRTGQATLPEGVGLLSYHVAIVLKSRVKIDTELELFKFGYPLFTWDDFTSSPEFVNRLKLHSDPVSSFLYQKMNYYGARTNWEWYGKVGETLIEKMHHPELTQREAEILTLAAQGKSIKGIGGHLDPYDFQNDVFGALNKVIEGPSIYESNRFHDISLRPETTQLMQKNPTGTNLILLNRMLIEDAYPRELSSNHKFWNGFQIADDTHTHVESGIRLCVDVELAPNTSEATKELMAKLWHDRTWW